MHINCYPSILLRFWGSKEKQTYHIPSTSSTPINFLPFPVSKILLPSIPLNLKVLRNIQIMLHPDQIPPCVQNHRPGMRNGISPRGKKSKARITPRTILRYLHYRRRITERDIRSRGTEPVQPQIIPTQVPAEAKPPYLGNDESVQEIAQARDHAEDGQLPDRHSCI